MPSSGPSSFLLPAPLVDLEPSPSPPAQLGQSLLPRDLLVTSGGTPHAAVLGEALLHDGRGVKDVTPLRGGERFVPFKVRLLLLVNGSSPFDRRARCSRALPLWLETCR